MNLFTPLRAGEWQLNNRIVMASLTRSRAGGAHIPNQLMAEYYRQRASAGLIITEATMVAADACAYGGEGGLFDNACVKGWTEVTQAVHARDGKIIAQLWHPGRATHSLLNKGLPPISSTARAIRDHTINTPVGPRAFEAPRRLSTAEIPGVVRLFRMAAERSQQAGFDGVQIHAANGYLIDQFLRDGINDRTDEYGGSVENRSRLLLSVVDACVPVIGAGRIAVRLSLLVDSKDSVDSQPFDLMRHLADELGRRRIAALELRHGEQSLPEEGKLADVARVHFTGVLLRNGGFDRESAEKAIISGSADAVTFGRLFIANPDLVWRLRSSARLNQPDRTTFYTPGPLGYTDYPNIQE